MNRERLCQLRDMIAGIPESQLDLLTWVRYDDRDDVWYTVEEKGCGAICCALGFAAQYPPFVEQGLSLRYSCGLEPYMEGPSYRSGLLGFTAAEKFFGLTLNQSTDLFDIRPHNGVGTDKEIFLDRLDKLLKAEDAQP